MTGKLGRRVRNKSRGLGLWPVACGRANAQRLGSGEVQRAFSDAAAGAGLSGVGAAMRWASARPWTSWK